MLRESSTEAHLKDLAALQKKWDSVALRTRPADRGRAEKAVNAVYQAAKLEPPLARVWCGSPFAMLTANKILDEAVGEAKNVDEALRWLDEGWSRYAQRAGKSRAALDTERFDDNAIADIRVAIVDAIERLGGVNPGRPLTKKLTQLRFIGRQPRRIFSGYDIWGPLTRAIQLERWIEFPAKVPDDHWAADFNGMSGGNHHDIYTDSLAGMIQNVVKENLRLSYVEGGKFKRAPSKAMMATLAFGQHDAHRLAYVDFCKADLGSEVLPPCFEAQAEIARNAGWWLPRENICWIADRPATINLDRKGRLQDRASRGGDGQPAIRFRDGWSVHARDGQPE